jgi:hypothetical protein
MVEHCGACALIASPLICASDDAAWHCKTTLSVQRPYDTHFIRENPGQLADLINFRFFDLKLKGSLILTKIRYKYRPTQLIGLQLSTC